MSDVLAVAALGDALGVPYEGDPRGLRPEEALELKASDRFSLKGLWSDDTSMALCIALAAPRFSLLTEEGLSTVAHLYKRWAVEDGGGIGGQTRAVLGKLPSTYSDELFASAVAVAKERWEAEPEKSAGNGGLMRVHPVAFLPLSDDEAVGVARNVTLITHADPLCDEASVLWVMMLRHALKTGELDPQAGMSHLPRVRQRLWRAYIEEALSTPSEAFGTRGWWVVPSFQQALSAVAHNLQALRADPLCVFREILACGPCDSDTICAIAGGLMGALGVELKQFPLELQRGARGQWPRPTTLFHLQALEATLTGNL